MSLSISLKFYFYFSLTLIRLNSDVFGSEFLSSDSELINLFNLEEQMISNIDAFIAKNENKLKFLKNRLLEYGEEHRAASIEGPSYFENPFNKYLLIKRLTIDWERLQNLMMHAPGKNNLETVKMAARTFPALLGQKLFGSMDLLLKLQDFYRLGTKEIASGQLQGINYGYSLTSKECFEIGQFATNANLARLGHSWLLAALSRLKVGEDFSLRSEDILFELARAKAKLGDLKGANETLKHIVELRPDNQNFLKGFAQFNEENKGKDSLIVDYSYEHEPLPEITRKARVNSFQRFRMTCNNLLKPSPSETKDLHCKWLTNTHPFLFLAPFKMEILSQDPRLVLYHDVLSDAEIEVMKKFINNRFQRASVIGKTSAEVSKIRTSQLVFVPKTDLKLLETIDQRVEDMTGLNLLYAEDPQFSRYHFGGHYFEHFDYFSEEAFKTNQVPMKELGNRIATVLFYLSDVELGGGTAFPVLKQHVLPKKRSAVFWFNLHSSGRGDTRTLHGGCPVLVGSKLVLNRWIRENDQSDRRPCQAANDGLQTFSNM